MNPTESSSYPDSLFRWMSLIVEFMKKKQRMILMLCGILFSLLSYASCPTGVAFPKFSELTPLQQSLISAYLPNAESEFDSWSLANDGLATEFLANTQAISRLKLQMADGSFVPLINFIVQINHIEGDRVKSQLNGAMFDEWRAAGAKFRLEWIHGKVETGHFHFDHGDLGGSLHPTYDIQGYTSYIRVPRIQINYRMSDHEADIDLDAYAPWIFGFIPDPFHLTWNNSDPRCWMPEFSKKYGKIDSLELRKQ